MLLVKNKPASFFFFYHYDGMGDRLSASRNGVLTQYIYDASGNLLAKANSDGDMQAYFIYGLGLMAMVDAQSGELYVYHFDGTGHTVAMTNSSEQITHRYAYSPYGKILAKEETVSQPFTYAGQVGIYTENIANIYYMRARYYNAELKQFISEDPAGFSGGINLYAYVGGNPLGYVDPSGEVLVNIGAGLINAGIDAGIQYFTNDGNINLGQTAIAFGAGFTGAAAAQRISQVARLASTVRQVGANAIAGGTINTIAGALNGDGITAKNFAFGVGGSLGGSAISAAAKRTSVRGFGTQGVLNGAGRSIGTLAESFVAGGGAFGK